MVIVMTALPDFILFQRFKLFWDKGLGVLYSHIYEYVGTAVKGMVQFTGKWPVCINNLVQNKLLFLGFYNSSWNSEVS